MRPDHLRRHGMSRHARTPAPQLVIGVSIMAIGILLTLDRLDVLNAAARLLRYWPLGVVALGAAMAARRRDAQGRIWGFGWMFVGVWLLLNSLDIVRVGFWELFWPFVMILVGLNLVRQTLRRGDGSRASHASGNLFAVMAESKRTVAGEPFTGASMTAFMGGCVLDLRQALLAPGQEAVVDVFGLMAGHEIIVPAGWNVVPDVVNFLAEVDDKRLPALVNPDWQGAPPPRLVLRGFLMMAGTTIKS